MPFAVFVVLGNFPSRSKIDVDSSIAIFCTGFHVYNELRFDSSRRLVWRGRVAYQVQIRSHMGCKRGANSALGCMDGSIVDHLEKPIEIRIRR